MTFAVEKCCGVLKRAAESCDPKADMCEIARETVFRVRREVSSVLAVQSKRRRQYTEMAMNKLATGSETVTVQDTLRFTIY
jgi:hypothetical protein